MARVSVRVLSRRQVVAGVAATAGLAACDDTRFGATTQPRSDADSGGADTGLGLPGDPEPIAPVTPNADFYVTSCCGTPEIDGATWSCLVRADETDIAFDLAFLEALDARDREHTLECIGAGPTNQAISNAVWSGLPLPEVFEALGVATPDDAVEIVFVSEDGYSTSLPVSDLDKPVWLVWRMNGVALPAEHGFPARLLVPGRYGMKNPKWIVEMAFSAEPYTGFWEGYGWSETAEYKANALIEAPRRWGVVAAGDVRVQGTAFAGSDPVVAVQVAVDGGDWADAEIDYSPGGDVWTLWHLDVVLAAGDHVIAVRCETESGAESGESGGSGDGLDGYDGGMEVGVQAI